jgi:hypothetical protein
MFLIPAYRSRGGVTHCILQGLKFSPPPPRNFQKACGTHPVSYSMGKGGPSPAVKWPEQGTNHLLPPRVEVEKEQSYIVTPSIRLCSL